MLPINNNTSFYTCPRCDKVEPSTCKAFQLTDLDIKHACFACRKHTAVKLWKCKCGTKWHACKIHRQHAISVTPEDTTKYNESLCQSDESFIKRRRTTPNYKHTYDDILTDDIRRDNKRRRKSLKVVDITLGNVLHKRIHANLLGPILTKRFRTGGVK